MKLKIPIVFRNKNDYHYLVPILLPKRFSMQKLLATMFLSVSATAFAADVEIKLIIENHRFQPEIVNVQVGQKVKLLIENRDPTPEEFESHSLNREKVIPGKSTGTVYIGPLAAGSYPFVGEFNDKTAKGVIVAK